MKKLFYVLMFVLMLASFACAATVTHRWDEVAAADGYRLYMSTDMGENWTMVADEITTNEFTLEGLPEDVLLLFRVSAYNSSGESIRMWSGSWYDHRLKPLEPPGGNGIQ